MTRWNPVSLRETVVQRTEMIDRLNEVLCWECGRFNERSLFGRASGARSNWQQYKLPYTWLMQTYIWSFRSWDCSSIYILMAPGPRWAASWMPLPKTTTTALSKAPNKGPRMTVIKWTCCTITVLQGSSPHPTLMTNALSCHKFSCDMFVTTRQVAPRNRV